MYTMQPPLHPATIVSYFNQNHVRLTLQQLAQALQRKPAEVARFGIRTGSDGRIGWPEVAPLEQLALALL